MSVVHCEMCGHLWKWEDWTPESKCPICEPEEGKAVTETTTSEEEIT